VERAVARRDVDHEEEINSGTVSRAANVVRARDKFSAEECQIFLFR
jgi:hypothetical protein